MTWTRPDLRKISPELVEEIANMLRLGVPVRWAAEAAGIHWTTHYDWIARGNEWLDGDGEIPESEVPFVDYAYVMRRATAEGKARIGAEAYRLATRGTVPEAVRAGMVRFLLTHTDRDHYHPKHAADESEEPAETIEVVWPD